MDTKKIGSFISSCRKEKGLTQMQLAEKLNITNRAVSKWETGKSIPDASVMLDLCEILGISANELLRGERIDVEHYQEKADENIIEMKKNNEAINKSSRIGFGITLFFLLVLTFWNAYQYGVQEAISSIPFRVMIIATLVWALGYIAVTTRKDRK